MDKSSNTKLYNMSPIAHSVNIFHLYSQYHFLKINCYMCKHQTECEPIKHKREICVVAKNVQDELGKHVCGRCASFASDDFYVSANILNKRAQENIARVIKKIKKKFVKESYVRE